MKIFPSKKITIQTKNQKEKIFEKLKTNTKNSKYFINRFTDKDFIGIVENERFQLINSKIGIGAITVFNGKMENDNLQINISLNKPFKILFGIILLLPIVAIIIISFSREFQEIFSTLPILLVHLIFTRFAFINVVFKRSSDLMIKKIRTNHNDLNSQITLKLKLRKRKRICTRKNIFN